MAEQKVTCRLTTVDDGSTKTAFRGATADVEALNKTQAAAGTTAKSTAASMNQQATATQAAGAAAGSASQNFAAAEQRARGMAAGVDQSNSALGALKGIMGAVVGGEILRGLGELSDGWANTAAKVALVAGAGPAAVQAQQQLLDISNRTQSSLEQSATLYTRIGQALVANGTNQADASRKALSAVSALESVIKTTGATQQQVNSIVLEFTEAINEGSLAGRQFTQIYKEAPGVINAIAKTVGVTTAQLKVLASEGKVSAAVVLEALSQQQSALEAQAANIPTTIGRAWTVLENSVEAYVGSASQSLGVGQAVAQVMLSVARNIGLVVDGLTVVAGAAGFKAVAAGAQAMATAVGAAVAPERALALAQADTAAAAQVEATAEIRRQEAILAALETSQAAIAVEQKLAAAELQAAAGADARVAAASRLSVATDRQVAADAAVIAADGRLAAARATLAAETAALTVAQAASTAEMSIAALAGNGLMTVGRGLLSVIGGWPGLLLGAGAAFLYLATRESDAEKEAAHYTDTAHQLAAAQGEVTEATLKAAEGNANSAAAARDASLAYEAGVKAQLAPALEGIGEAAEIAANQLTTATQETNLFTKAAKEAHDAWQKLWNQAGVSTGPQTYEQQIGVLQARIDGLAPSVQKATEALEKQTAKFGEGAIGAAKFDKAQALTIITALKGTPAYDELAAAIDSVYDPQIRAAKAADAHKAAIEASRKAAEAAATASREWAADQDKLNGLLAALDANLSGPYAENQAKYNAQIKQLGDFYDHAKGAGKLTLDIERELGDLRAHAAADLQANNAATRERLDLGDKLLKSLDDEVTELGMTSEAAKSWKAVQDAANQALKAGTDLYGVNKGSIEANRAAIQQEIPALLNEVSARQQLIGALQYQKQEQDAVRQAELSGISDVANSFAQFATGQIHGWHGLWKSLLGDASQFVTQMIATYLRLEILQPLVGSLLGWGSNLTGIAGGGAGSGVGSLAQIGASAALGGSGGGSYLGINPATGQPAYDTGSGLASQLGSYAQVGGLVAKVGGSGITNLLGTQVGGVELGTLASIGGGVLAGIGEYKAAGGGAAGLVGGAAYGIGAYYAGTVATAAIGGAATAGAGGALAAGSAGLGAIPVVGWIALAAIAINMISGGKLFGTSWKVNGATSTISVGDDGGTASAQLNESKQSALFGGKKTRSVSTDPGQDAIDAANAVFTSLTQTVSKAAKQLGIDVPSIVEGAFQSFYDKKGNLKKQQSEVLGKVYTETFEDFTKRITAENVISVVEAAAAAAKDAAPDIKQQVDHLADAWRSDAATLIDGSQLLLAVQGDLQKGIELIAGDNSIVDVVKEVEANQQANEGLTDTYARLVVANHDLKVALTEMGIDIGKTGTDFVNFAADIETAAGGAQQAEALWNSFFQNFYTGTEQLSAAVKVAKQSSDQALTALGENTSVTMEQFRKDFEAALPTLTPDQVVQWLQAGQYLTQLTEATSKYNAAIGQSTASTDPFVKALQAITSAVTTAEQAAGSGAAAETELGFVHFHAAQQVAMAIAVLQGQTANLVAQLYGGTGGTLDEVNAQIQALQSSTSSAGSNIGNINDGLKQAFETWQSGLKSVNDFLQSLLTNTALTTLTPEQQMQAAQAAYQTALGKAQAGDATAISQLPALAQSFLQDARGYYSSGDAYSSIFNAIQSQLAALNGVKGPPAPGPSGGGSTVTVQASSQLQALFEKQAQLEAEQTKANRLQLAVDLAQHLRDLSAATGKTLQQVAATEGVNLQKLAGDLGVDLKNLDENSVEALAGMASELGVSLTAITSAVGLQLTDLGTGVKQLAGDVGINLNDLTVSTAEQLAVLAQHLGTNLATITAAIGVDLGKLADKQSLLNDALGDTINGLPDDEKAALRPLFDNLEHATNDADANAAIAALEAAVTALPAQEANKLAPYFDDIAPSHDDPTVTTLKDTNEFLSKILDEMKDLNDNFTSVPAHAQGTSMISRTGLALIHQGEMVIDPASSNVLRHYGIQASVAQLGNKRGGDSDAVVAEVRALRIELSKANSKAQKTLDAQNLLLDKQTKTAGKMATTAQQEIAQRKFSRR